MAFESRAMENIATAPATRTERIVALWLAVFGTLVFAALVPFSRVPLPPVPALVPAVGSVIVMAQAVTAILFYVQYRIARSATLGLLAIAYAISGLMSTFYMLTFPGVFSATGLLAAGPEAAGWIMTWDRTLFATLLVAFAAADRLRWHWSRATMRWVAGATALLACCAIVASIDSPLAYVVPPTRGFAPIWTTHGMAVIELLVLLAALTVLLRAGLHTVTQVWLSVVALNVAGDVMANTVLSSGRYSVGWYGARLDAVIWSSIMLGVFLVKINELLLRVSERNRALAARTEVAESEVAAGEQRYRSLANVVPQLIWTADADGTVDYVNERWVAYTGLDLQVTRERGWRAALDEQTPTALDDGWHASLRSGQPLRAELPLRGESGMLRWFLVTAVPLRGADGRVTRWIASCTDIDRSKRLEEREAFLSRASDRLSASLDSGATLSAIAELALGRLADWLRIDLLDDAGNVTTVKVASVDAVEARRLRPLVGRVVDGAPERSIRDALSRRETLAIDAPDGFDGGLPVRPGKVLLVPLTNGGTPLGSLTLVQETDGDELPDVALARDFGRRAAQALAHARLYERERSTADALQRAMLPQTLPQLDHISFSASYSAASESQRVGGDFYDAFALPNGHVALTIGDVTGHGLEAAVIMGEIRQALRAAAFESSEPAATLDRASRLLVAGGRGLFVTAIFGVLDVETGWFRYATAGHPAPLVWDGRRVTRLSAAGLPLGLRDDEDVDLGVTLLPGSTLVMFTDGLLEFARDIAQAERRLEAAIGDLADSDDEHLAAAIMKRVLGDHAASDDIAILTATIDALPSPVEFEQRDWRFVSSDGLTAALVRREVGSLVTRWTERPGLCYEAELAFGELFANVVRHAPGCVEVQAAASSSGASLTVSDRGPGFAAALPAGDELAETGRGLRLVRSIADEVAILPLPGGGSSVRVGFARHSLTGASGR